MNTMHTVHRAGLRRLCVCAALTCLPLAARAVLPVISTGETVVFSDDFADNTNDWTNVAVVNDTGTAASTQAAITGGAWTPSLHDSTAVTSAYTLTTAINALDSSISLYMRVRVDNPSGTPDGTKFDITFGESTGNRFFQLTVRDASSSFIDYRNASGTGVSTPISSFNFTDNTTYFDFKITLTPGSDVSQPASAEAFLYNTATSTYDNIGSVSGVIDLDTGLFNSLKILNRNGVNGAVYFDSVAITTTPLIPEPSAFATVLGAIALAFVARRRNGIVIQWGQAFGIRKMDRPEN